MRQKAECFAQSHSAVLPVCVLDIVLLQQLEELVGLIVEWPTEKKRPTSSKTQNGYGRGAHSDSHVSALKHPDLQPVCFMCACARMCTCARTVLWRVHLGVHSFGVVRSRVGGIC